MAAVISSYLVVQRTINDVNRAQNELFNQQVQLSSGRKSQDFSGMADQTQAFLSLDASLSKNDQYLNDNKIIEVRLNSTANALTNVITIANNLQNLIAQRRSGVSNTSAFQNQLDGLWQQFNTELNTSVNNQYLFSGTKINVPAVDTTAFPKLTVDGVPDAGYYRGNNQNILAQLKDDTTIQYNMRADEPAIQNLYAGLALASRGDQKLSDDDFRTAIDFVQKGIQGVISMQALVNSNKVQLSTIDTSLNNLKLYMKGVQESIGNTNIIEVSTQVSINQSVLQAAFQAFAKISSLKLSDFLR